MSQPLIELLKHIYEDNRIALKYGVYASEEFSLNVGLRQGCPLSSILFSLYIGNLERQLLEAGVGFRIP